MSFKGGCLKPALFGCLGLIVLMILIFGVSALIAWNKMGDRQIEDTVLTPSDVDTPAAVEGVPGHAFAPGPGRVVLDLGQGEFQIRPAEPGEGLSVKAEFDQAVHKLEDRFASHPDSGWVYHVRFYRTIPALQAIFREIFGGGHESRIEVYLPRDVPLVLEFLVKEGGLEAELGGLWITEADLEFNKGGFALGLDEPLKEPMESLRVHGSIGGFEATGLGNASPRILDVRCKMGGAELDLRGPWAQDSDISLDVTMGGMEVRIPAGVEVLGVDATGYRLQTENPEVPIPVLNFTVSERMGEIEVRR